MHKFKLQSELNQIECKNHTEMHQTKHRPINHYNWNFTPVLMQNMQTNDTTPSPNSHPPKKQDHKGKRRRKRLNSEHFPDLILNRKHYQNTRHDFSDFMQIGFSIVFYQLDIQNVIIWKIYLLSSNLECKLANVIHPSERQNHFLVNHMQKKLSSFTINISTHVQYF